MTPSLTRTALLTGFVAMLLVASACAEETENDTLRDGSPSEPPAASTPSPSATGTATATASVDSGTTPPPPPTDAGADTATPPPSNAFTGAPAYAAALGRTTSNRNHANPAGRACLECHRSGGSAPNWFAAGTVYSNVANKTPAARVEVRFRAASGAAKSVYTDALGNFYLPALEAEGLAFPLQVGARDGTTVRLMSAGLIQGNCASSNCHGGAPGPIHLP